MSYAYPPPPDDERRRQGGLAHAGHMDQAAEGETYNTGAQATTAHGDEPPIPLQDIYDGYAQPAPPLLPDGANPTVYPVDPHATSEDPLIVPSQNGNTSVDSVQQSLNREPSKSARIHVHTGQGGPTITVSQPPISPVVGSGEAASPFPNALKESTGIKRANHPGQINLEGLQPRMMNLYAGQDTASPGQQHGRTGIVDVEGNEHDRLAALADEIGDVESEAVSEQPAPGQAIIRDEAFLHGLSTIPRFDDPIVSHYNSDHDGTTTPGATSNSSYDPVEDLENVDVVEGETDGMPSKPPRSVRRRQRELERNGSGWKKLRRFLGVRTDEHNLEDMTEKGVFTSSATNMKSVPVHTSTGLRGTSQRPRVSAAEREAAKLVKTHKLLHGHGTETSDDEDPNLLTHTRRGAPQDSEASTPDALDTMQQMDARPVRNAGVLGQLLKLYDQQNDGTSEATESQLPESTVDPENRMSLGGGLNLVGNKVVDVFGNHAAIEDVDPTLLKQAAASKRSTDSYRHSFSRSSAGVINLANHGITLGSNLSQNVVKNVAADVGLDMDERPKAARSGAGTIGALIATSGNLIGAVSPLHAQLGPNPSRPGFTLDRYLLPDMNEKTLRRTAKIVAEAAPVPKKMRTGIPGAAPLTPNSFAAYVQQGSNSNPYFPSTDSKSLGGGSAVSSVKKTGHAIGHAGKSLLNRKWPPSSASEEGPNYMKNVDPEQVAKQEWKKKLRRRKAKSKKQEIFITMHVAAILKRQEFLLKLSRCLMMFGAPTHRIEQQIQATANMLEVNCRCVYFPSVMLLSFGDENTHTSETKIIKQGSSVDLTKLTDMHTIFYNVIHDKIGVEQGSKQLDALMRRRPLMRKWHLVIVSGLASASITVGDWAFKGSFLDALISFTLGAFMCFCQLSITSELYSSVFEIVFATLNSFIAMGLHQVSRYHAPNGEVHYGRYFCYEAIVAGSIVMILPGFIVLTAALELQSKSLVSGSVRLVYAIIYSVLLGLGIMIGALPLLGSQDARLTECRARLDFPHWYNTPPGQGSSRSFAWAFLTVPMYSTFLSLRNQAKPTRKEFPAMVIIAICGWLVSNFAMIASKVNSECDPSNPGVCPVPEVLQSHAYLYSAMGSFTVGILSNIYGRFFGGRSFVVSVPGILYQLPTGMTGAPGSTTLWNFGIKARDDQNPNVSGNEEVTSGLQIGAQLLNVSLGIAIGLFASSLVMFIIGGRKARGTGMLAF